MDDVTALSAGPQYKGNRYENINATDQARVHAGNNYYTGQPPEAQILDSLWYCGIDRHSIRDIEPHKGTFDWIFDQDATRFQSWLRSSEGVFWINGKAGSGKSTLMKFISEHPRTKEILQEWAGKDVIIAKFFFWKAGKEMERSQRGLLQSLLHQLLDQHKEIVRDVVPDRWNTAKTMSTFPKLWSRSELSTALEAVVRIDSLQSRFCFFIDGLDEFEGDHYGLIKDLATLSGSHGIKLCVSSRPWNVFQDADGPFTERQFALQRLTASDMEKYIRQNLEEDERFRSMAKTDSSVSGLVFEIRGKAEGVFLWVKLVVSDLRRGLGEHDSIANLRRRLAKLPPELDAIIRYIFDNIEPIYKQCAAQCLALEDLGYGMTLLTYSFLETDIEDAESVFAAPILPLSQEDVTRRVEQGRTSVNKWCRDLLEVRARSFYRLSYERVSDKSLKERPSSAYSLPYETTRTPIPFEEVVNEFWEEAHPDQGRYAVSFPHRAIRDFVKQRMSDRTLQRLAGQDFDPTETKCRLLLRLAKSAPDLHGMEETADRLLRIIKSSKLNLVFQVRLINELDRVGQHLKPVNDPDHWSVYFINRYEDKHHRYARIRRVPSEEDAKHCDIMSLALHMRLEDYFLKELVKYSDCHRDLIQYYLECELAPISSYSVPRKDVISELIKRGGNVNELKQEAENNLDSSGWQKFLNAIFDHPPLLSEPGEALINMVEFLLRHGADPDVELEIDGMYNESLKGLKQKGTFGASIAFELVAAADVGDSESEESIKLTWFYTQIKDALERALENGVPGD